MSQNSERLTPEELAVIQSRYGLELTATATSDEVDPELWDHLETSALRKLRHHTLESMQRWRQAG